MRVWGSGVIEGKVAVDFVDTAVFTHVEVGVGEGFGEFGAEAFYDEGFELFLLSIGDGGEGGDSDREDVTGAVTGAGTWGKGGADIEEAVVFGVSG